MNEQISPTQVFQQPKIQQEVYQETISKKIKWKKWVIFILGFLVVFSLIILAIF